MALFNRDYDRDLGYRNTTRGGYAGDSGRRGYDRDWGDRAGSTWSRVKRGTRDFLGVDDRYDRGYRSENRGWFGRGDRYGTDYRSGTNVGYGRDYSGRSTRGYDQPYWGYDTWRYDQEYKSRHQTDAGDPFGDRQSNTPMRIIDEPRNRGWFGSRRDYDRGYRYGSDYGTDYGAINRYDRDTRGFNPTGYDPYEPRGTESRRLGRSSETGYGRGGRGFGRDW